MTAKRRERSRAMADDYRAGLSLAQVGRKYGRSKGTVLRAMAREGVAMRPVGRQRLHAKPAPLFTAAEVSAVAAVGGGMQVETAAELYHIAPAAITAALARVQLFGCVPPGKV
jgi:hypothetical protein